MAQTILLVLGIGCLAAFGVGVWLLIDPGAGGVLSRPAADVLQRPVLAVRVERVVYRYHRWFGGGVVLAALFILARLWNHAGHPLPFARARTGEALFWESFTLFALVGSLFALAVGVVILARPSLLRAFETWANSRVSRESLANTAASLRQGLLAALAHYPRAFALLLVVVSGGVLAALFGMFSHFLLY